MKDSSNVGMRWVQKTAICLAFFWLFVASADAQFLSIAVQPSDQTVIKGDTATFHVQVATLLALSTTYQWQMNGKDIPGASGSQLLTLLGGDFAYSVTHASPLNVGNYSLKLSSLLSGTVTSSSAALTVVNTPVTVTSVKAGTDGFHLHLTGITGVNFVVSASTNLVNWIPVYTNTSLTGSADYTDAAAANFPARYYKVSVQ